MPETLGRSEKYLRILEAYSRPHRRDGTSNIFAQDLAQWRAPSARKRLLRCKTRSDLTSWKYACARVREDLLLICLSRWPCINLRVTRDEQIITRHWGVSSLSFLSFTLRSRKIHRRLIADGMLHLGRPRRDDGGEKTEEPENSFHVGSQSIREETAQGRFEFWQRRQAQVVRLRGLDFSD